MERTTSRQSSAAGASTTSLASITFEDTSISSSVSARIESRKAAWLSTQVNSQNAHHQPQRLARDWVQLLASDAHGAAQRPPLLAEATSAAARLVGPAAAGALVGATPFAIVQDLTPPPMPAAQPAGWLPGLVSRLRSRQ